MNGDRNKLDVTSPRLGRVTTPLTTARGVADALAGGARIVDTPIRYLDQVMRGYGRDMVECFQSAVRSCAPKTGEKALVELSIVVSEPTMIPKCRIASLHVPKLISIDTTTQNWHITLRIVCQKEAISGYVAVPDNSKTSKSMDLALEEVGSFWRPKGPMHGTTVGLQRCADLACHLVQMYGHHVMDAITVVRTMCMCDQEETLKKIAARLLVEGGTIAELKPVSSQRLASRRILDNEQMAVIDMFAIRVEELKGTGLASLVPSKWCIAPIRVLKCRRGLLEGVSMLILDCIDKTTSRSMHVRHLTEMLTYNDAIYCTFVLYDTLEDATEAVQDLEKYVSQNRVRGDMQVLDL